MVQKKIYLDRNAREELRNFPEKVQIDFEAYFDILKREGMLEYPYSKKIGKNLFEIRVKYKGEYRGFYTYLAKEYILILHFFQKKSRKTPINNIKTAKRRLKNYE